MGAVPRMMNKTVKFPAFRTFNLLRNMENWIILSQFEMFQMEKYRVESRAKRNEKDAKLE